MSDKDPRPFIKLDVGIRTHPKMLELSDSAQLMFIHLLCYCGQYLTDGNLSAKAVGSLRKTDSVFQELLNAGLVVLRGDGAYVVRDYLKHQSSADEVAARRERNRENGLKGGRPRKLETHPLTESVNNSETQSVSQSLTHSPSQKEVEVEEELKTLRTPSAPRKRNELFDAVMIACGIADPPTTSMGKSIATATAELKAVAATPAQVALKAKAYQRRYPRSTLTPMALAKHWSALPDAPTDEADRAHRQVAFWEN